MDLAKYRASLIEVERTTDLMRLAPAGGRNALDIGARDGHFSLLLADRFEKVTALDLTQPSIIHPKIECIQGNAAHIPFSNQAFDFVFCAEVLEHIPSHILPQVCREIERVTHHRILIGVPYKQDIRIGRTTCRSCGGKNPPWAHVNTFDEQHIARLFPQCSVERMTFVGTNSEKTNFLSTALMDYAGNPYGTYDQQEPCIHCSQRLQPPTQRNLAQRVATKAGTWLRFASELATKPRGNWMHVILQKTAH